MAYSDHFSTANIPYGIGSTKNDAHRDRAAVTRLGDKVVFLDSLEIDVSSAVKEALSKATLNDLAALSKSELGQLRKQLISVLSDSANVEKHGVDLQDVDLHLPIKVAEFTDFSCSKAHVLNAGEAVFAKRFLPPSFLHYPTGYSGTSSTIVVSGTPIQRPNGVYRVGEDKVEFGPSKAMDYELEFAAIIGKPTVRGDSVLLEDADDHIFGLVVLNDWSARDIQALEMTPLGPMNGKSFATTISPWVVTLEALAPFATAAPAREVPVSAFLQESAARPRESYDVKLGAELLPAGGEAAAAAVRVCTSNLAWMYWTFRDLVAQKTVNGCNLNTGDVLATGTVSGDAADEHGCLMEMNKGGRVELALAAGLKRTYLLDGDAIRLTAYCGDGVGFGECTGVITPARAR